jgi:hypothetical protein
VSDQSSKTPFLDRAEFWPAAFREQAKNVTSRVPAVDRSADQKNLKNLKPVYRL